MVMKLKNTLRALSAALLLAAGALLSNSCKQPYQYRTLGLGVYPGDPDENFAPQIVAASDEYRNLALLRAASHSSSYNYNQTAQLVTDGIIPDEAACWVESTKDGEPLGRIERGYLTDMNVSNLWCEGPEAEFEVTFHGYGVDADRVVVTADGVSADSSASLEVKGADGEWVLAGRSKAFPTKDMVGENDIILHHFEYYFTIDLDGEVDAVRLYVASRSPFAVSEIFFYKDGNLVDDLANRHFTSSWKSLTAENEWVAVDLGAVSKIDKVCFSWLNAPAKGVLQVSSDGQKWSDVADIDGAAEVSFKPVKGRYVRAMLTCSADGMPFELGEMQVWGRGGVKVVPQAAPEMEDTRQMLSAGGWKLQRSSLVDADGAAIASAGFDDSAWLPATVPGTVLTTYIDNGAVAHPNVAGNQLYISDSYFRSDFWYRDTFDVNVKTPRQFLHFDGINHKAQVWLNGKMLGEIDGAFRSADFDVTDILALGVNYLAVKVICNEHYGTVKEQTAYSPDKNGGILGADNPTIHASIGWDWIPTVRGRDMGIIDDVCIDYTGEVTVGDPFVHSTLPLPDTTRASVFAEITVTNHSDAAVEGNMLWYFGEIETRMPVTLAPGESRLVKFEPLEIENPRLWWPNGYGEPYLYGVLIAFENADGSFSDAEEFYSGIRQMDFEMEPYEPLAEFGEVFACRNNRQRLLMYVNGRRFVGFGGNWGLPEHLLAYRNREYDIAVGYHRDMNFTMIRNWVGMNGDREFYEACDRHGIMIWQDFWLANPWDGPDPADPERFNAISQQYLRRIRNHPSIGLYVGRNEGYPPQVIDEFLDNLVRTEHPGLYYIPHSAADGVSGGGPYHAQPASAYFHIRGQDKFHSEMGMPNVMNYENMARAFGRENLEPVSTIAHPNPMYGLHDYTLGRKVSCAQQTESFNELIAKRFGEPADARQFASLAQWVNYDGYRAMFEGRAQFRQGLLLWMSHPAWPSMVWQTYDYYFEPTAAYFACKKACEPIHIYYNAYTGQIEVVNYRAGERRGVTAREEVLDMNGAPLSEQMYTFDIPEDATVTCFPHVLSDDLTDVYYLRLTLTGADGAVLSENFYVLGREEDNLTALNSLGKASVKVSATAALEQEVTLTNTGDVPALMLRLKVVDGATGDLVLPVIYEDNYFHLMPGESRTVAVSVREEDCTGTPRIELEGFNI